MSNQSGKRKSKKTWWRSLLIIFLLLIISAAVYLYIMYNRNQQAMASLQNLQTFTYSKGNLEASVSGTGRVRANQTATLTWATSGTVGQVNVKVGDKLNANDILMSLDEENLPIDILQAEMEVISTQKSLDELYENASLQLAQLELDLINAQQNLEDLKKDRVVMNYRRCTDERIEEFQEDYDDAFEAHDLRPTDETLRAVDTALANLRYCEAGYTEDEVKEAEAKLDLAKENITSLELQITKLKDGPDPVDVAVLETQLEIARTRIAQKHIKAPFEGIVTEIVSQTGDLVAPGLKAAQVTDLSKLLVDVQISEVDIPTVALGQPVELVFDAYFEEACSGEVNEISQVGNESQGVVTYTVTINLNGCQEKIKPGMTAAVNIITDQISETFIVPSEAVINLEGQDSLYVLRDGMPVPVPVLVGAYSNRQIQILEADIKEGELIVINPPVSVLSAMEQRGRMPGFMTGR